MFSDRDFLNLSAMRQFSNKAGGRQVRDAEVYHIQDYPTAGSYSLEFFRVNGAQQDLSGTAGTVTDVSNMVMSGKMDEPFAVTNIGILFDSKETTDQDKVTYTRSVLMSGKLTLYLNQKVEFEIAPLARCGSPVALNGFMGYGHVTVGSGNMYNSLPPKKLKVPIFIDENDTFSATLTWSNLVTIGVASWIGIYLIGAKYYKG